MKYAWIIVAVLLALVVGAGCGSDESREDANDIGNGQVEKSAPAGVIAFNNNYPNVAIKCDGFGNLLFAITDTEGKQPNLTVVPGHPACTGSDKSYEDFLESNEQASLRSFDPPTNPDAYPPSAAVVP